MQKIIQVLKKCIFEHYVYMKVLTYDIKSNVADGLMVKK